MLLAQIQIHWVGMAFLMLFLLGVSPVLAKVGLQKMDGNMATALKGTTLFVLYYMSYHTSGNLTDLKKLSLVSILFLILAGVATGAAWICGFKALQMSHVNKAEPMTYLYQWVVLLLGFLLFHEKMATKHWIAWLMIGIGIVCMVVGGKSDNRKQRGTWWLFALLSVAFLVIVYVMDEMLCKNIAAAFRLEVQAIVALLMAWIISIVSRRGSDLKNVTLYHTLFIVGSAVALVWGNRCYQIALSQGNAKVVTVIAQFVLAASVLLSRIFLKERLSNRGLIGLLILIGGLCLFYI